MPKRPKIDPVVQIALCLPKSLVDAVRRELHDPLIGKTAYGGWGKVLIPLLRDWLKRKGVAPPPQYAEDHQPTTTEGEPSNVI